VPAPAAGTVHKAAVSPKTTVASRGPRARASSDEEPSTGASVAPPETDENSTDDNAASDEETPPPAPVEAPRRKAAATNPPLPHGSSGPYSVQIDAMMDRAGAQQMAQKIRAKGFEPYIVSTVIDGKTWYRLRVGHYSSPEQAQAAESRLHQEFNDNSAGN
jgi:septal ring-binding cell division protein DamX